MDEGMKDSYDVYAEFFDDESSEFSRHSSSISVCLSCRSAHSITLEGLGKSEEDLRAGRENSPRLAKSRGKTFRPRQSLSRLHSRQGDVDTVGLVEISGGRKFESNRSGSFEGINSLANIRGEKRSPPFDRRRVGLFSEIVETELEQKEDYEHFNDCLDTFPL